MRVILIVLIILNMVCSVLNFTAGEVMRGAFNGIVAVCSVAVSIRIWKYL